MRISLCYETDGGFDGVRRKPRADARFGLASQADPSIGLGSLRYRLKECEDSRKRWIFGTAPEVFEGSIEGAFNSRKE